MAALLLRRGDRVMVTDASDPDARPRPAAIDVCRRNGMYNVIYEDGAEETESDVDPGRVRPMNADDAEEHAGAKREERESRKKGGKRPNYNDASADKFDGEEEDDFVPQNEAPSDEEEEFVAPPPKPKRKRKKREEPSKSETRGAEEDVSGAGRRKLPRKAKNNNATSKGTREATSKEGEAPASKGRGKAKAGEKQKSKSAGKSKLRKGETTTEYLKDNLSEIFETPSGKRGPVIKQGVPAIEAYASVDPNSEVPKSATFQDNFPTVDVEVDDPAGLYVFEAGGGKKCLRDVSPSVSDFIGNKPELSNASFSDAIVKLLKLRGIKKKPNGRYGNGKLKELKEIEGIEPQSLAAFLTRYSVWKKTGVFKRQSKTVADPLTFGHDGPKGSDKPGLVPLLGSWAEKEMEGVDAKEMAKLLKDWRLARHQTARPSRKKFNGNAFLTMPNHTSIPPVGLGTGYPPEYHVFMAIAIHLFSRGLLGGGIVDGAHCSHFCAVFLNIPVHATTVSLGAGKVAAPYKDSRSLTEEQLNHNLGVLATFGLRAAMRGQLCAAPKKRAQTKKAKEGRKAAGATKTANSNAEKDANKKTVAAALPKLLGSLGIDEEMPPCTAYRSGQDQKNLLIVLAKSFSEGKLHKSLVGAKFNQFAATLLKLNATQVNNALCGIMSSRGNLSSKPYKHRQDMNNKDRTRIHTLYLDVKAYRELKAEEDAPKRKAKKKTAPKKKAATKKKAAPKKKKAATKKGRGRKNA
ncbi:hypothetical protein ACHAXT_004988 [Thalassiosira profunda]